MSTYLSLHLHIVFSTKQRRPWIRDEWMDRLHEYLGGTIRGLDGIPEAVGGVADHVHLLVGLKRPASLRDAFSRRTSSPVMAVLPDRGPVVALR